MADPRAPFLAYNRHIASRPLLDAGVRGALGAGAGILAANKLNRIFTGMDTSKVSEEDLAKMSPDKRRKALRRNALIDKWEKEGRLDRMKTIYALVGGGLMAAPPIIQSLSGQHSIKDNISKLINKEEFFEKNPEKAQLEIDEAKQAKPFPFNAGTGGFRSGRTINAGMYKKSSLNTFFTENVPVHQARNIIHRDPFLSLGDKVTVDGIIGGTSEGDSGMTSGFSLTDTAIKAGVGAVAGFAFGKTMGNLFSLEDESIDRLSRYGGVAGAIYNTGILNGKL